MAQTSSDLKSSVGLSLDPPIGLFREWVLGRRWQGRRRVHAGGMCEEDNAASVDSSAAKLGLIGGSRLRPLSIAGLVAAEFFITLDGSAVTVALPTIRDVFDADMGLLQWTEIVYMLVAAALAMPLGAVGDRLGRGRVLAFGLIVFGVGAALSALAPSMWVLLLGRAITGAGAAAIAVLALALLTAGVTTARVSVIVGAWTAVSSAATVLAPAFSGFLVQTVGWRWVFAISVIPALVVAAIIRVLERSQPDDGTENVDWVGSGILAAAVLLLVAGFNEAASGVIFTAWMWLPAGAGLLLGALFITQQRRSRFKLTDWSLLSRYPLPLVFGSKLVITMIVTGAMFEQTMLLQNGLDYSPMAAGLMDIPPAITAMLFAVLAARIVRWLGLGLTVGAGFWFIAAGLLGMSRADYDDSMWALLAAFTAIGIGFGLSSATLAAAVMNRVPVKSMGGASGVLALLTQLAAVMGIAVAGAAVAIGIRGVWYQAGTDECSTQTDLLDNVVAGAFEEINGECGPSVASRALDIYTDGITDVLFIGGVVLAISGLLAWLLLRRVVESKSATVQA